ncbi:MAG: O-antigen ligase domain-containing protein [Alphaproteobacteria bacterium]|nr:O-antigen ligase domain-containing protein [Alphaproteobacteria bacterium]
MRFQYDPLLQKLLCLFAGSGVIAFIEPSPYEFLFIIFAPLCVMGGLRLHRSLVGIFMLWIILLLAGFLALMPYLNDGDAKVYQLLSLYLVITLFLFAMYFSDKTQPRLEMAIKGYTVGCVVITALSLIIYSGVSGFNTEFVSKYEGRLSATFKDPNVYGSYLILAACYLAQAIILKRGRYLWLQAVSLFIVLIGVFLSFSRGSWGATFVALLMVLGLSFLTCGSAYLRQRMMLLLAAGLFAGMIGFASLLTVEHTRELLFDRFTLTKDYDEGPDGRFGNQQRSIPMLLDRPLGFGPLRYRLVGWVALRGFQLSAGRSSLGFDWSGWSRPIANSPKLSGPLSSSF